MRPPDPIVNAELGVIINSTRTASIFWPHRLLVATARSLTVVRIFQFLLPSNA